MGSLVNIVNAAKALAFGDNGGVTHAELKQDLVRNTFSKYLPWLFHDKDSHAYSTLDNRFGYIWEITPLAYCGIRETKQIETLLGISFPKRTILQFVLTPDPNCDGLIAAYEAAKTRKDPLAQKTIIEYANYLRKGKHGLRTLHGIPVRNFRAFFCVKTKEPLTPDMYSIVEESLMGAHLQPRRLAPGALMQWARQLFNDPYLTAPASVDELKPLRKQIINADSTIDFTDSPHQMGKRFFKILTPKLTPNKVDPLSTNKLAGGIMGANDDNEQICTPFIWSLNILFDDLKSAISQKAQGTMVQKAPGSFAKAIQKRVEEFSWALDVAETERFYAVIPSLVVFGDSSDQCIDSVSRVKRIWSDYEIQEEDTLAKTLLIASLPLGLYDISNNISILDRHFYLQISAIARVVPVQADFRGSSSPVLAYIGRKGQFIGIDVFDKRGNNHNFMVAAGSGSGKSFNLNYLCNSYYATGSKVRIVDIGGSYEKSAKTNNGRFMDFGRDKIIINPFNSHAIDQEDRDRDMMTTATIAAEMAYSASRQEMTETEWTLIKEAVRWAVENGETINGIDAIQRYLRVWPQLSKEAPPEFPDAIDKARALAFNLHDFTSKGVYGRFFNGPSTFDIQHDDYVVLELERLQGQKELFNVVVMQVMNSVTQDLYLSNRSEQRFILFEEAWSFFSETQSNRIGAIIGEGYRRARKYEGSFGIVTQSPLDLIGFGSVGKVIKSNAAYKFFLECSDYAEAVRQGLLDYEGLSIELLESVRNNKPKYSEIFFETPFGRGIGRLTVDPWNYWVNTSDGKEVARFNQLLETGKTPYQAIQLLSGVQ